MSSWFEDYEKTKTGRRIAHIIDRPDRILEFRLLSNLGKAAVQALAAEVAPIINALPDKRARDMASQFTGWRVGRRMRDAGYEVKKERGRVSNAPFKTGAVWRRIRRVRVVDGPWHASEGRAVELEVKSYEDGSIGGQGVVVTPPGRSTYKIEGLCDLIEDTFCDAVDYADRYGFSVLSINDPEGLFPRSERERILKEMGFDDRAFADLVPFGR